MEWIKTSERLPENQDLNDECNKYHNIKIEGFDDARAMYCDGEWYFNYVAKIIKKVTHWLEPEPLKVSK